MTILDASTSVHEPDPPGNAGGDVYWTASRLELLTWFRRNASSLGALYSGATRIAHERDFPGRMRFVAHAVREIRNRLPEVITGERRGGTLQYVNRIDSLSAEFQRAALPTDGSFPDAISTEVRIPIEGILLPPSVYQEIASLIRDHVQAREKPEEAAFRMVCSIDPANSGYRDAMRPVISNWLDITHWFVKRVHESSRDLSAEEEEGLLSQFEQFEAFLRALIQGFFKTSSELDEILDETNS